LRAPGDRFLQDYLTRSAGAPFSGLYLTRHTARFYGWQEVKLSRFDCALQSADMAATLGLFLGAVGTTSGAWDEDSAWYLMGAAAAVGAILGASVGANDPKSRVRLRMEPSGAND
jgi:hypothetical protein